MRTVGSYRVRCASELGNILRWLRRREGVSQRELGARIGVHANTVIKMEKHPDRSTLGLVDIALAALNEPRMSRVLKQVEKKMDRGAEMEDQRSENRD